MRARRATRLLLWAASTAALVVAVLADTSVPVQVQLRSPWPAPPLVLEILEAAHEEQPSSFFTLLTQLTSPWAFGTIGSAEQLEASEVGARLQRASEEEVHRAARRILEERELLQQRGQRDNFELALALRSQTPKIAAFWQLYDTNGLHARWQAASNDSECGSWVDFAGQVLCSEAQLISALKNYDGSYHRITPAVVPFDHVFSSVPDELAESPTAVLYADPFSLHFWSLHKLLTEHVLGSRKGEQALRYVLRWKPTAHSKHGFLAGYGAALDLKKVDYLVIDDRKLTETDAVHAKEDNSAAETQDFESGRENHAWIEKQVKTSKDDRKQSMGSLEEHEMQDLAVKAAYVVAKSKDPLRALRHLSQDFPRHAVALARSAPNPTKAFLREMEELHERQMQEGGDDVWLNGKALTNKEFQPFGLLSILRSERDTVNALTALNLTSAQAVDLLTSSDIARVFSVDDSSPFFDASDRIERDADKDGLGAIVYWNDLEAEGDDRYSRWSADLRSILRPLYPGSFPMVRRNLFNAVVVTDMARTETCQFLSESVQVAASRFAIRWGLVPSNLEDAKSASAQLARFFWLVEDQGGIEKAAKYLRRLALAAGKEEEVPIEMARAEVAKILKMPNEDIDGLLNKYAQRETAARAYVQRLRADDAERGLVFVNGQIVPFVAQFFQLLHQTIAMQSQMLAPLVYYGQLTDDDDVSTHFYDLPEAYSARSELLFPPAESTIKTQALRLSIHAAEEAKFIQFSSGPVNTTVWLAADLDSTKGAKLVRDVAQAMNGSAVRLALVHTPSPSSATQPSLLLSTFLYQLLSASASVPLEQLVEVLDAYHSEGHNLVEVHVEEQTVLGSSSPAYHYIQAQGWSLPEAAEAGRYWDEKNEVRDLLRLSRGDVGLVVNGRAVSGFDPAKLSSSDYRALFQTATVKANTVVQELSKTVLVDANLAALAASVVERTYFADAALEGIFGSSSQARTTLVDRITAKECAFEIGDRQTASLRFAVVLDPLSETSQAWSSVLQMLAQMEDVYIRVILNPHVKLTELPIKRYYRYSAPNRLSFDGAGQTRREVLQFRDMPLDAVLTMGLDAPPSWLTMPVDALYDLDNIRLKDVVTPSVQAVYELKYILIEGHARDEVTKSTPRGLQLVLETMDGSQQLDTIVMANLAYFQFRARPGLYRLRIREGRSTHLFDMVSVGNAGFDSPKVDVTGNAITLSTLQGLTIYPRLAKKKGMEKEILVEEEGKEAVAVEGVGAGAGNAGVLSRARGLLHAVTARTPGGQVTEGQGQAQVEEQATINVFTVASGHLYERMTYIMILSVLKHTSSTVKFWFIENFLSPSFKEFIPHLAQEYGFKYELITYAWPHWLRAQKEKQRSIWGMKVLFLDVIFPLNLSKVIFVDADQIVRADLKELIDTDLKGAPYGFPPMGNDSFDMDNFRFWEQPGGYWQKFLNGKPYPISALFVIDLNRFRLQAAGDKLRGHYQALSQDPGSLSNLDQDLVASMIHVVNIHSLAKEWLWCETWCSWEWYDRAKSIDLCSNPKTKEPKLDRAKRQIPEWTEYDDEVASVGLKFREQGKLGANVVAPAPAPAPASSSSKPRHDEL